MLDTWLRVSGGVCGFWDGGPEVRGLRPVSKLRLRRARFITVLQFFSAFRFFSRFFFTLAGLCVRYRLRLDRPLTSCTGMAQTIFLE